MLKVGQEVHEPLKSNMSEFFVNFVLFVVSEFS